MGGRWNGVSLRTDRKGDVLRLLGSEPRIAPNISGTLENFWRRITSLRRHSGNQLARLISRVLLLGFHEDWQKRAQYGSAGGVGYFERPFVDDLGGDHRRG